MGRQSGWRHEPGIYKACPNKAVTRLLCVHKRSVKLSLSYLSYPCLSVFNYKAEMASKQQQVFRMCVYPCPRNGWGYTRSLCCLFGRGAYTVSARGHCDVRPLRTLRSRLTFFHNEGTQACVPQGSGPAVAEAQRRLQSWGLQMDLSAGLETATALSLPSPDGFSASSQGWEACAAVSSTPIEAQTLLLSDSD